MLDGLNYNRKGGKTENKQKLNYKTSKIAIIILKVVPVNERKYLHIKYLSDMSSILKLCK